MEKKPKILSPEELAALAVDLAKRAQDAGDTHQQLRALSIAASLLSFYPARIVLTTFM